MAAERADLETETFFEIVKEFQVITDRKRGVCFLIPTLLLSEVAYKPRNLNNTLSEAGRKCLNRKHLIKPNAATTTTNGCSSNAVSV